MMTNAQLYLAIGVPILFNGVLAILISNHFNARLLAMENLWRSELRRVEDVIDARLTVLERHLGER